MKITNLSSGSRGNCTFIEGKTTNIIVDIGVNKTYLNSALIGLNKSINSLDAVLITHEHSDHISGLEALIKYNSHILVYVLSDVWQQIVSRFDSLKTFEGVRFINFNQQFSVGEFTCLAMQNVHDSVSCCSFVISTPSAKFGICTDLGAITDRQIDMLKTCKVVMLECNHDTEMLMSGSYPMLLKKRISGQYGHLSNDQCAVACKQLVSGSTKVIILGHISENNNFAELAYSTVANYIGLSGLSDIVLLISYQKKVGKTITIKED